MAIIGRSGSGKSTVLAVLRGDVKCNSGAVELHGMPIENFHRNELAKHCSESTEDALMFNRSVRHNVAYGRGLDVQEEEICRALHFVDASGFVQCLKGGLDGMVGERGSLISTGERQRLSIARSLLKDVPLLLMDEAASSVDALAEAKIIDHLLKRLPNTTVIYLSHRVSSLSGFDRIVVMEDGRIADIGPPDQLLVRSSLYRNLLLADKASHASTAKYSISG